MLGNSHSCKFVNLPKGTVLCLLFRTLGYKHVQHGNKILIALALGLQWKNTNHLKTTQKC